MLGSEAVVGGLLANGYRTRVGSDTGGIPMRFSRTRKIFAGLGVAVIAAGVAAAIGTAVAVAGDDDHEPRVTDFTATQQGTFIAVNDPSTALDDTCFFLTGTAGDTMCTFELEGSGHSAVLGDYEESASWLIAVPAALSPGAIVSGSATLTGKRGELHLEAIGPVSSLNVVGPPDAAGNLPGIVTPPQPFKIVGGTGKFKDATGSIIRSGSFESSVITPGFPGSYDIAYMGAIVY